MFVDRAVSGNALQLFSHLVFFKIHEFFSELGRGDPGLFLELAAEERKGFVAGHFHYFSKCIVG